MKRIHKKIIAGLLPLPLLLAITFCYCSGEKAFADENHPSASTAHHQEAQDRTLAKAEHSEHQDHSRGDHECTCPKHLSFLSQQPLEIVPNLSSHQLLAKNALAVPQFGAIRLTFLVFQSQGPPGQDHRDQVDLPIFLKISNLRI